jgi:hypothetical protein
MRTVKIYALTCPHTGAIRYVGSTIQTLGQRLQQHLFNGRTGREDCSRGRWIKALWEEGKCPGIEVLETVEPLQRRFAEAMWGARLLAEGAELVNDRPAGDSGGTRSYCARWTPELLEQLGKVADAVIAEQLGVTRKTVTYYRKTFGIPASFDRTRNVPPPNMGGWNKAALPQGILDRLGTAPDYLLGREAGVAKAAIARERRARGIAPYARTTGNDGQYRPGHYPSRWLKKE